MLAEATGILGELADGMEHMVLGKYHPKTRTGDQKGAFESGSSSESSLLTGKYNLGKIRLPQIVTESLKPLSKNTVLYSMNQVL